MHTYPTKVENRARVQPSGRARQNLKDTDSWKTPPRTARTEEQLFPVPCTFPAATVSDLNCAPEPAHSKPRHTHTRAPPAAFPSPIPPHFEYLVQTQIPLHRVVDLVCILSSTFARPSEVCGNYVGPLVLPLQQGLRTSSARCGLAFFF